MFDMIENDLPDELMIGQWGGSGDNLSTPNKPHATGPGPGVPGGPGMGGPGTGPGGPQQVSAGPSGPGGPGGPGAPNALQNGAVDPTGQNQGVSPHQLAHHLQLQQQVAYQTNCRSIFFVSNVCNILVFFLFLLNNSILRNFLILQGNKNLVANSMALQQQAGNKNPNAMQIPPNVAVSKTGVGNVGNVVVSGDPNMVVSLGMANANSMQSSMSNVMPGVGINSGASGGKCKFNIVFYL